MKKELLNPVVLSNKLARYGIMNFSVVEWRIFLYAISKIQPYDDEFRDLEIRFCDFCKMFKISSYEDVRNACISLNSAKIVLDDEELGVVSYCDFAENTIHIRLDVDLGPFLFYQRSDMTIFDLGYIAKLSSKHAIRYYIFSASFKSLNTYNMSVKNFAGVLGTNLSAGEIIRKILTPAINSINALTNIQVNVAKHKDRYYFYARERSKKELKEMGVETWRAEALKDKEESLISFEEIGKRLFSKELEEALVLNS